MNVFPYEYTYAIIESPQKAIVGHMNPAFLLQSPDTEHS